MSRIDREGSGNEAGVREKSNTPLPKEEAINRNSLSLPSPTLSPVKRKW